MQTFDIIKTVSPKETFRVAAVMGKFDIQSNHIEERFTGEIDTPNDWQIGLIVGKSGTGKTTIAKQLFPESYITTFDYNAEAILDDMPSDKSVEDITKCFNSVGFSSPPSWLKPYSVLSNGEKMRVDLARAILSESDLFVFDEFTSVVDRQVAKIGSFAMQKAIRKTDKKFIAVTCHFDVEDWLLPDWVFDTDTMTFRTTEGQKKNRPNLGFKIYETKEKGYYWKMFAKHHYLNHSHHNAARVFICTIDDEVCGFCSVLHLPNKAPNIKQGHRVVVLPDYQGVGVGILLIKEVGKILTSEGLRFRFTTSNPAMIKAFKNDPGVHLCRSGRQGKHVSKFKHMNKVGSHGRLTTTWEIYPK